MSTLTTGEWLIGLFAIAALVILFWMFKGRDS